MLCFSRYVGETIVINGNITVKVIRVGYDKVRIAIDAPRDVSVNRGEIEEKIREMKKNDGAL
jgi:carbon storage regulator